ncbi:geranylgeranylglyceryl/heptaprenylglyceryl phosphate synthase [Mariniflexile aquimaris]|uniref:Geranylgeranylglyceryl phosphate synthase n=1 Tax=Mariniflexile aquimaris TaxID=881009 RepID=A0ABW3BPT8_9FLAO
MKDIYNSITASTLKGKKLLAVLIDPDKAKLESLSGIIQKIDLSLVTHIFVGGSIVKEKATDLVVKEIKKHTKLPIVLFPGDVTQITNNADAILFLSLISGRNAEYLIEKHVQSVAKLKDSNLEVIPTGYILIESGNITAVEHVSRTKPLPREPIQKIVETAKAGELLGMKLIYLEAGSGAKEPVSETIIKLVKQELQVPLIVGGGIRTRKQLENAYQSGADLVVIGTAFEENESFFEEIKRETIQ